MNDKPTSIPKQWLAKPGAQIVLFILTVLYVISPVDIVPDVIPILGWFDDLAVFVAQVMSFIFYLKQKRQDFAARQESTSKNEGDNNGR